MVLVALGMGAIAPAGAMAVEPAPGWIVRSVAQPTSFPRTEIESGNARYLVLAENVGGAPGSATIVDKLPPGVTVAGKPTINGEEESAGCKLDAPVPEASEARCPVSAGALGESPAIEIPVVVSGAAAETVTNTIEVLCGEGEVLCGETSKPNLVGVKQSGGLDGFGFAAFNAAGLPDDLAGGHPNALTSDFDLTSEGRPELTNSSFWAVEEPKELAFYLPLGMVGDPLATKERCALAKLMESTRSKFMCPTASVVGSFTLVGNGQGHAETGNLIVNLVPEAGHPAELGFWDKGLERWAAGYAGVVRTSEGYMVRMAIPGVLKAARMVDVFATFYGDPTTIDGEGSHVAFLTNPTDCSEGPLKARVELNFWQNPEEWVEAEDTVYPSIEGCDLLKFEPSFEMAPSEAGEGKSREGSSQADEPSAYSVTLKMPQPTLFEEAATPAVKEVSVELPEGVTVSPSAASAEAGARSLEGCAETGPEGIEFPDVEEPGGEWRHPDEPGEGEEIWFEHDGEGARDGLTHLARGHCPRGSTLGTVEVITPLLENPLKGHVYLAAPHCGGAGQPACTEASATNGELYGLYIEAMETEENAKGELVEPEHPGLVVKLAGWVAADPVTGRLTATFGQAPPFMAGEAARQARYELPQLPFSEMRMHFHGGPRASLANPQACGSYETGWALSSWAGQEAEGEPGKSPFAIDWDGSGGACPASLPFAPSFSAGVTNPVAGAFSPFVLSFSRQDREQDLHKLSVTLPLGLLGKIAGIPLCGEAQADAGTCSAESQIGTASAWAGAGEDSLHVEGGRVYLTGAYEGGPFGLSIVVPAVAGPFNLGNVVVRAAIHIDPETGRVTVTSDPLPQSRDGVPFRLRRVDTTIERAGGFTFNPTDCERQTIAGTITGAPVKAGEAAESASVSSPFAVSGCAKLPFEPSFTVSTQAKTSKADGASLTVKVAQKAGEANIHKVNLTLPKALPARLSTLQQACTEAQFAADPAGCPEGSVIGTAVAHTPVLSSPLTGPGYLVSHGGAAFPDVEFVLQGEGVTIMLDGKTQIKNGITYSRFETVPDAPVSSFETVLPEGPHSALTTAEPGITDLCTEHLEVPTVIVGQNGAGTSRSTPVQVTGCSNRIAILSHHVRKRTLTLKVYVPARGRVKVKGRGLTHLKKAARRRRALTFKLRQKRHGKLRTRVRVIYTPAAGKHHHKHHQVKTLRVRFRK